VAFDQEKAIALDAAGNSYGQIALDCGVSKSTIQRFFIVRNKELGGAK
jgi:transposase